MAVVAVAVAGLLAACTTLLPLQDGPQAAPDETVLVQGDGWILSVGDPMLEPDGPTLRFHDEDESTVSAQLAVARGMTWFWIVLPGRAEIARISVRGQDGTIRDQRTDGPYALSIASGGPTGD